MMNITIPGAFFFSALLLLSLCAAFHPENISAQGTNAESKGNVIHFFAGLSTDKGDAPRIFDYPLYIIEQGESIIWQNDDTHAHTLKVTPRQSFGATAVAAGDGSSAPAAGTAILESQRIEPGSTASFKFANAGLYQVQSLTDPSLQGEIVVTNNMTTLVSNSTTGLVKVALSWYRPVVPKAGGGDDDNKTVYFKIQFLDKQTGKIHPHVDYTFAILNSDGREVATSPGSIHSGSGEEFTSASFQSTTGAFTPVITILGVSFVPVAPEETRFSIVVGP